MIVTLSIGFILIFIICIIIGLKFLLRWANQQEDKYYIRAFCFSKIPVSNQYNYKFLVITENYENMVLEFSSDRDYSLYKVYSCSKDQESLINNPQFIDWQFIAIPEMSHMHDKTNICNQPQNGEKTIAVCYKEEFSHTSNNATFRKYYMKVIDINTGQVKDDFNYETISSFQYQVNRAYLCYYSGGEYPFISYSDDNIEALKQLNLI